MPSSPPFSHLNFLFVNDSGLDDCLLLNSKPQFLRKDFTIIVSNYPLLGQLGFLKMLINNFKSHML